MGNRVCESVTADYRPEHPARPERAGWFGGARAIADDGQADSGSTGGTVGGRCALRGRSRAGGCHRQASTARRETGRKA